MDLPVVHIAASTDMGYAPYLAVALQSLKDCKATNVHYTVHILTDYLDEGTRQRILCMQENNFSIDILSIGAKLGQTANFNVRYLSQATYYRLYLEELLPQIEKVLYIDCDVLILKDPAWLYDYDIDGYYVAASQDLGYRCPDWPGREKGIAVLAAEGVQYDHYFNAGVLLMNLKQMRQDHLSSGMLQLSERNDLLFQDQDVLNIACRDKWKEFPMEWNYRLHIYDQLVILGKRTPIRRRMDPVGGAIVHFTSLKPWDFCWSSYAESWWTVALRSTFASEFADEFIKKAGNDFSHPELKITFLQLKKRLCFFSKKIRKSVKTRIATLREKQSFLPVYEHIQKRGIFKSHSNANTL